MKGHVEYNLGHMERVFRVGLGVILLAVGGLTALPTWGTTIAIFIGIVALVTGVIGYCPAWRLFGINTCDRNHV